MLNNSHASRSASKLWKHLTPHERLEAALAFWRDPDAGDYQRQGVDLLARQMKFRQSSIRALPVEQKARYLASIGGITDGVAGRALVSFHLASRRPMMAVFLDALAIQHENGVIVDDPVRMPDRSRVAEAVRSLASTHPPREVALYLSTLLIQDADTWGGLADLPELGALT